MASAIEQMQAAIDQGATVTEALRRPRIFPPSWMPVIEIGEKSGDFAEPLRMLYRYQIEFSGGSSKMPHLMMAAVHGIIGLLKWIVPVVLAVMRPLIAQMQLILVLSGLRAQLEAGIPLVEAMGSLGRSIPNAALRWDILQVHQKLWEGALFTTFAAAAESRSRK